MTDPLSETSPQVDLSHPPSGCSVQHTPNGFILSATTRSLGAMYFGAPVGVIFTTGAFFGLYRALNGEFIDDHGTQMSQVKGLLLCGGLSLAGLLWCAAMVVLIAGRVRISVECDEGIINTGLGFLRRTKHFHRSAVQAVSEVWGNPDSNTHPWSSVFLKTEKRIEFGKGLTDTRRYFVLHALRQLMGLPEAASAPAENFAPVDLAHPPRGCRLDPAPNGFVLTLSTRCYMGFIFLAGCVFPAVALYAIYVTQVISGQFDLKVSLIGIPFLFLGAMIFGVAAMGVFGQARLIVNDDRGEICVGVGPIGWRHRFNWSAIRRVRNQGVVYLDGDERVLFHSGPSMTDERSDFVTSALRQFLAARAESRSGPGPTK